MMTEKLVFNWSVSTVLKLLSTFTFLLLPFLYEKK
jgi:hypothetical protein